MYWLEHRRARARRDATEARCLILTHGEEALAVLERRAQASKPNSRDQKHWLRIAKVAQRQLETNTTRPKTILSILTR